MLQYGTFSLAMPRRLSPDTENFIRTQNPYAPVRTDLIGSPPTQVASTWGDLMKALNWDNSQRVRNDPANFSLAGGPSLFSPSGVGTTTGNVGNPFSTLRNVKNPDLQSAIDSILSQVKSLSTNPNENQNVVKANVKSPEIAGQIAGATGRFNADVNDTRQSFADFAKNYMAAQPQAEAAYNQESSAIGNVYDPNGLAKTLADINNRRTIAATQAAQRAIANAMSRTNANRILTGDSSYLDAILADTVGNIGATTAKESADIARQNALGLTDLQGRFAGTRGNLLNQLLSRALFPIEARQRLAGNELAQLAGLSNLTAQNTFFQLDSPEQMLARRLALLGDVGRLDLGNNFYGLSKPYEGSTAGLFTPQYRGPVGGSPFDYGLADYLSSLTDVPGIQPLASSLPTQASLFSPDITRTLTSRFGAPPAVRDYTAADIPAWQDYYENPELYRT